MAINTITGKPGAGKTYLSILLLLDRYYHKVKGSWEIKDPSVTVITDINELQLPSIDLKEYCRQAGITYSQFFTPDYQKDFTATNGKCVYVLDECQAFIGRRFKDTQTILYFDTHRHYDAEIFLISQDQFKICKEITALSEFEYRAISKTLSLTGELKYNILQSGEIIGRKATRPKKEIFSLYRSAIAHNQHVKKNKIYFYIAAMVIISIIMGNIFFNRLMPSDEQKSKQVARARVVPVQPVSTQISQIEPPAETMVWTLVDWIAVPRTKRLFIQDPQTLTFVDAREFPYKYKAYSGDIYALIPISERGFRQRERRAALPGTTDRSELGGLLPAITTENANNYK